MPVLLRKYTDYGFHRNPKLLGLGTQFGQMFKGIWGIFGRFISTHFGTVFHNTNQPVFLQKTKPLYKYLGLGFEFGPQRIKDLAIVCS